MRIVIDCRFWGAKHTGLGIYTQNLVENIAKLDRTNTYILLVRSEDKNTIKLGNNFSTKVVNIEAYSLSEQLFMPWILYGLKADRVHFPSINVPLLYFGSYIVTVHDLIKHFFRGKETTTRHSFLYWLKFVGYLLVFRRVVYLAKRIITPSVAVKKELLNQYQISEDKIVVTYEASVIDTAVKSKIISFRLPLKFAVYTGNAYPHKNLNRLIRVWSEVFLKTQTKLVLIGARSVFTARIQAEIEKEKASQYVEFLGFVDPDEIVNIYRKAQIYVFPTLSEGFGLPGLDAMKIGLPVVCSDIPVLREIYDGAAIYFDPKNEKEMTSVISKVLKNPNQRKALVGLGTTQSAKYSWSKTAEETLLCYLS